MPSTLILHRTVKRCPTKLNFGVQHSRKLLNCGESSYEANSKVSLYKQSSISVLQFRELLAGVNLHNPVTEVKYMEIRQVDI